MPARASLIGISRNAHTPVKTRRGPTSDSAATAGIGGGERMSDDAVSGQAGGGRVEHERVGHGRSGGDSPRGLIWQALPAALLVFSPPAPPVAAVFRAGAGLPPRGGRTGGGPPG